MIELRAVSKRYPGSLSPALDGLSALFPEARISVLLGPSGSGKSTLLRLINRLVEPDTGEVLLCGRPVREEDPITLRRSIGYAIQGVGLFPHLSVSENIGVVPALLGWERSRIRVRVEELLELVRLPREYLSRRPAELSGGEAQRVGVARALAADPPVLLMDEPFGALDGVTRLALQDEFLAIQGRLKKTVVFVTHDVAEAVRLADRIYIMRGGRVAYEGRPEELLRILAPDHGDSESEGCPDGKEADQRFARDFLGPRFALELLSRVRVEEIARSAEEGTVDPKIQPVSGSDSLSLALSRMIAEGRKELPVSGARGGGLISLADILAGASASADRGEGRADGES